MSNLNFAAHSSSSNDVRPPTVEGFSQPNQWYHNSGALDSFAPSSVPLGEYAPTSAANDPFDNSRQYMDSSEQGQPSTSNTQQPIMYNPLQKSSSKHNFAVSY